MLRPSSPTVLFTSFATWLPHQRSNSSDELLVQIQTQGRLGDRAYLLRQVPVDFQQAPQRVITAMKVLQPEIVVCCGMAEGRSGLTVESNGKGDGDVLTTAIEVEALTRDLLQTEVSHDAGNFVCNHLYYSVLNHIQIYQLKSHCVFIHVPILEDNTLVSIQDNFVAIVQRIVQSTLKF